FFNEFTLRLPKPASSVVEKLAWDGVFAGVPATRLYPGRDDLSDLLIVAVTEQNTKAHMDRLCSALEAGL
ncbi:MAG: glycine dehydrogenase, partial [Rhodospirillaceae bacterium]|nr:glycine dehydrogenase [Rhodospirillaceae bacterium]